jgi:hypothetical protein
MMAQKQFTGKFCKPEEAPMMVLNGEIVNVLCDTAFVINKYRMNLYEVSKNMILKNNTQNVSKLIKAYDQTLVVVSSSYDSLVFNYRKLDEIFRSTMEMNKQTLNNTQSDLEKATNSLKVTEKMLNEAILKLNERDKNSWKKKVLYFGGGILTGVLVMLVVD